MQARVQVVHETLEADGNSPAAMVSYFLDGAHTPESILTCARWFARASSSDAPTESGSDRPAASSQQTTQRVLVFNCTKVQNTVAARLQCCMPASAFRLRVIRANAEVIPAVSKWPA